MGLSWNRVATIREQARSHIEFVASTNSLLAMRSVRSVSPARSL